MRLFWIGLLVLASSAYAQIVNNPTGSGGAATATPWTTSALGNITGATTLTVGGTNKKFTGTLTGSVTLKASGAGASDFQVGITSDGTSTVSCDGTFSVCGTVEKTVGVTTWHTYHWDGTIATCTDCTDGTGNYLVLADGTRFTLPTAGPTSYVSSTYRSCIVDNDTQSATPLVAAQFSGGCVIPKASTIVEVDVWGGTGAIGGAITTTGTGSVNLEKYTPNGGATATILSGVLATVAGQACALAGAAGTCLNGTTSSGTVTISTAALAAGDWVRVSAATPDAAQTWYRVAVVYTVN